jgi:hypothetical protein
MKCVVIACKNLVEYVELREVEPNASAEEFKIQLSNRLTNLMTVAKTHATNNDITSCEPLIAAAGFLTSVVMNLVEISARKVVAESVSIVGKTDVFFQLPELKVFSWLS